MPYYPPPAAAPSGGSSFVPVGYLPPVPPASRWYSFPPMGAVQTLNTATNVVYGTKFGVLKDTPVPRFMSTHVTTGSTAAGTGIRAAIYKCNPDSQEPVDLFFDLGMASSASGIQKWPNIPPSFPAGTYVVTYIAIVAAIAVRGWQGGNLVGMVGDPITTMGAGPGYAWVWDLGTAAWPATLNVGTMTLAGTSPTQTVPRVDIAI